MHTLLLIFLFFPFALFGHPLDLGLLEIELESKTTATLDLNSGLVAELLGVSTISDSILAQKSTELFQLTLGTSKVEAQGSVCKWQKPSALIAGQSVRITSLFTCANLNTGTEIFFSIPFMHLPKLPKTFQLLVKIRKSDSEETLFTLKESEDQIKFNASTKNSFIDLMLMGIEHIGATPSEWIEEGKIHFPEGIDHILFLLALILVGGSLIDIIKTATGFTVGHSITLALGALGFVSVSTKITESAIALSIAYVALESLFIKKPKHRWKLATSFGLVHGLGFASALTELQLKGMSLFKALIGFNLGVELGQLVIVLCLLPFLLSLNKIPKVKNWIVNTIALFIFIIGSYWFIQRAFST